VLEGELESQNGQGGSSADDIHKVSHGRGDVTHGEKIEAAELDLDTKITEMSCLSQ